MVHKLLKFHEFAALLESANTEMIAEGGAFGHIEHPFEDVNLTFADLKEMISLTVNGGFGPENFTQLKTDGQQLSISWKGGQLISARNKSHLKNKVNLRGHSNPGEGLPRPARGSGPRGL